MKEAARAISAPPKKHWQLLSKLVRYLIGTPILIMKFPWQEIVKVVTTYTDSDWAGCVRTARSTSGGIVASGDHVMKTYRRQQNVVVLSSAEAEVNAMVAASAENLAGAAYAKDLGGTLGGEVFADSSASVGLTKRCGIRNVRHLRV